LQSKPTLILRSQVSQCHLPGSILFFSCTTSFLLKFIKSSWLWPILVYWSKRFRHQGHTWSVLIIFPWVGHNQ
jgi:hypothetical protein